MVVAAFNQVKALVGAFSVITNLRMELFEALIVIIYFVVQVQCARIIESDSKVCGGRVHTLDR